MKTLYFRCSALEAVGAGEFAMRLPTDERSMAELADDLRIDASTALGVATLEHISRELDMYVVAAVLRDAMTGVVN